MDYNIILFLIVSAFAYATVVVVSKRIWWLPPALIVWAVLIRILGSQARYEIINRVYKGFGDANRYYAVGMQIVNDAGETMPGFFTLEYWTKGGGRWGTHFIMKLSGFILNFIGDSIRAEFVIFSMFGFIGLYAIIHAFRNAFPESKEGVIKYAMWLWFIPSLWYWPCTIGKETLVIFAFGLSTVGYLGKFGKIQFPAFISGIGLAFMIRPHVALVICLAAVIAQWIKTLGYFNMRRVAEIVILGLMAWGAFMLMSEKFGMSRPDMEGMKEYVEYYRSQTSKGGSRIKLAPLGIIGAPVAFINVWARPFPWELRNATGLIAGVELYVIIWLAWTRRKMLRVAIKEWRYNRLLRFVVPLALIYTLMIGFTMGNMGIIARQRTPVMPFILMFILMPVKIPGDLEKDVDDESENQKTA